MVSEAEGRGGADWRRGKNKNVEQELAQLLACAGLDGVDLTDQVDQLAYGQQKMLEIVRAILCEPVVLLLDEPAAGLNHKEMDYIVALIDKRTTLRINRAGARDSEACL